jgi:hypothetical protein
MSRRRLTTIGILIGLGAAGTAVAGGLWLDVNTTTPNGYEIGTASSLLVDTGGGVFEEAWLALNGNNAIITSPGDLDLGLLSLYDQDDMVGPYFTFDEGELELRRDQNWVVRATELSEYSTLSFRTPGHQMWFVSNDTGSSSFQNKAFQWKASGLSNGHTLMDLWAGSAGWGTVHIAGSLYENESFDLAEGFWKGDRPIGAGDVVRIDPAAPNAVRLAEQAADPTVVGVVSTGPGIVMGGGAFSVRRLAEIWGEEVAAAFERERDVLWALALERHPELLERTAELQTFDGFLWARLGGGSRPATEKTEELARLRADYDERCFAERFARVALAGRVPVKVDAGQGGIRIGDLLMSSANPGHAMRADGTLGTIIGKALQPLETGQGVIMMQVMLR